MSVYRTRRGSGNDHETLDFVETVQYEHASASIPTSGYVNYPLQYEEY